ATPVATIDNPNIQFNAQSGRITIYGNGQANAASIKNQSSTMYRVTLDGSYEDYAKSQVKEVVFYGYGANDSFFNTTSVKSRVYGGDGNDFLFGGSGPDYIVAGSGNDYVYGNDGNDELHGSTGNDYMAGGNGNDLMWGDGGEDSMYGGAGNDSMFGGTGNDWMVGDAGNDMMVSIGGGVDTLTGGAQWDNIWMDKTDVLQDASSNELSLGYIHKVDQFFAFSYNGGSLSTPVSKELYGQSLADPLPMDSGLSLKNFKNNPLFNGSPKINDVFQGSTGDCYFLSRLAAMAKANPDSIRKMVTDLGDGTYAVRFYRNGVPEYVRVDADLWVENGTPKYAKLGQGGALWAPIIEKAYAFWRTKLGNYGSINGGNGGWQHSSQELLGGAVNDAIKINDGITAQQVINWVAMGSPNGSFKDLLVNSVLGWLNDVKNALNAKKAVVVGHKSGVHNDMSIVEDNFRRGQHITTVDKVLTDSSGNPIGIRLRDQYGQTNNNGYSNGYVDITDFTRIHFILGSAGVMTV
ncbi:MAG: hypothetical protein KDA99_27055, partial [Planctomycetales bacterium]|nr:hypothetical protein [Planctomycetales bacterium]